MKNEKENEVRVHVDEPWDKELAGDIDDRGARRVSGAGGADAHTSAVANNHIGALNDFVAAHRDRRAAA